jgi:hypothetical protein
MDTSASGHPLMDIVLRFFDEEQWNYQVSENKPVIRSGYRGERGTWVCYARVDEENQRFVFYSLMGMNIASQYRSLVAEYLTRVNYGLPTGNFEIHLDTGDVRFKTGYEGPAGDLTIDIIRALVYANVHAMDQYMPGVVSVVYNGLSPEAALARVEAQGMESLPDR